MISRYTDIIKGIFKINMIGSRFGIITPEKQHAMKLNVIYYIEK